MQQRQRSTGTARLGTVRGMEAPAATGVKVRPLAVASTSQGRTTGTGVPVDGPDMGAMGQVRDEHTGEAGAGADGMYESALSSPPNSAELELAGNDAGG
jgi:hypothetical protein